MSYTERALARIQLPTAIGDSAGAVKASVTFAAFTYCTDDAAVSVETAGYFNLARDRLTKGNTICASMVNAGVAVAKNYIVTNAPATGNVTIAVFS